VAQYIAKVAGLNGGLRFSPDFDLSVDLEARTEKGAAEMADGLHWLTSMAQSQMSKAGKGGGTEGLKYRVDGKHILLSLHVPEEQIRAGVRQIRAGQAGPMAAAVKRAPVAAAVKQAPVAVPSSEPSSGLPPPPAGTIRVQSSDMGTVLLPVGKPQ